MSELETFKNYINGQWFDSSTNETFEQRNPAKLSEVTGLFPISSKDDIFRAIEAAQLAFSGWLFYRTYNIWLREPEHGNCARGNLRTCTFNNYSR